MNISSLKWSGDIGNKRKRTIRLETSALQVFWIKNFKRKGEDKHGIT